MQVGVSVCDSVNVCAHTLCSAAPNAIPALLPFLSLLHNSLRFGWAAVPGFLFPRIPVFHYSPLFLF